MKKLLTVLLITFSIISIKSYSQCTPDTTMTGLTMPTGTQGLDTAFVGQIYNKVIYLHVPEDTIVPPLTVAIPIDKAKLKSVQNLPAGFMYLPNNQNNEWMGGEYGCIQITGTPTLSDVGNYNIVVTITVYSSIDSITDDLVFEFNIVEPNSIGENISFSNINAIPNPADDYTKIEYFSNKANVNKIDLFNNLGELVYSKEIESKIGKNIINLNTENLPAGIYYYIISDDENNILNKLIIK